MIDIAAADTYFSAATHSGASSWASFSRTARTGAVAEARRLLSRALRRALDDELPAYVEGDTCRDDFAVFEQAHFILRNSASTINGGVTPYPAAVPTTDDEGQQPEPTYAGGICAAALAWLGVPATVSVRG